MRVPISLARSSGIIHDPQPYTLPPDAFSDGKNIRFRDGKASKYPGLKVVDASTGVPGYFITLHKYLELNFWVYAGKTAVWAFTDASEADITRAAGAYTGAATSRWNSASINGLLVLNNSVDPPQLWSPPALATDLVALTNWPASTTAKVIRSFGKFLIALDVTKSGTRYAALVKWSHSADSGIPSSWDAANPTLDAGEINLWDTPDALVDCQALGNVNVLYKENSTWLMRFIGGVLKFGFQGVSRQSGLMAQDCAVVLPGNKHFAFTREDCVVHNGSDFESVIDRANKLYWFTNISNNAPNASFVVHVDSLSEVWICAPAFGAGSIETALIWNYRYNTWTIRDLPVLSHGAKALPAVVSAGDAWDSDPTQLWNSESTQIWDDPKYLTAKQVIRFISAENSKIYDLKESVFQDDSADYRSYIKRTGLTVIGRGPQGEYVTDMVKVRMLQAVWPHVEAAAGVVIKVYVAAQMQQEDVLDWKGPYRFVVGTDSKVNVMTTGRFLAVRFEESSDDFWALHGYDLELVLLGDN